MSILAWTGRELAGVVSSGWRTGNTSCKGQCLPLHTLQVGGAHPLLVLFPSHSAPQALRSLGVTLMTSTKVAGVHKAGADSTASSATTAATETVLSATATVAAAATATAQASTAELPARPQSPEAAAVESLAVLAAAAAAANEPSSSTPGVISASMNGTSSSVGGSNGAAAHSSTGEDASYVVQLEPLYASGSSSSSSLSADLVLWTAGARPASSPLQPFPLDSRGQLETDATLRVLKHSRVFALGDVSRGQPGNDGNSGGSGFYPATAQVAFQQADYAAWNIWSAINGRALLPFR